MNRLYLPLLCAVLCLPSFAQGETFETEEAWANAVAGNFVPTSFGSLVGREYSSRISEFLEIDGERFRVHEALSDDAPQTFDELPLETDPDPFEVNPETFPLGGFFMPQSLPWGELSSQNDSLQGWKDRFILDSYGFDGDLIIGGQHIEFRLNPELGQLRGISFYLNPNLFAGISQGTEITFFDGDDPVEFVTYSHLDEIVSSAEETTFIGWTNTQNLNVTRIVVTSVVEQFRTYEFGEVEDGADVLIVPFEGSFLSDGELVFGELVTENSPQELLNEILINLGSVPATGDNQDDRRITRAIDRLNNATSPEFWEDEDTLSNQGTRFFREIGRAQRELLRVDSPSAEVEQAISDLDSLLEGIVETEIADATAAGGRQNLLNAAAYYQDLADLYAAAGYYRTANALRSWAWYLARIS